MKNLIILFFSLFVLKGVGQCVCDPGVLSIVNPNAEHCAGAPVTFNFIGSMAGSDNVYMDFGVCQPYTQGNYICQAVAFNAVYTYNVPGTYNVTVYDGSNSNCISASTQITIVACDDKPECIKSFAPTPGDYMLSFWVREDQLPAFYTNNSTYSSGVEIDYVTAAPNVSALANVNNSNNKIIDGWQKVDLKVTIPPGVTTMKIKLKNLSSPSVDTYFDDIRFHPFNSGFKSYVYDPVTLRLAAELDDRNYATFYEYDEEGQLIRVKKETEKGIKTIKESRTSVKK